MLEKIKLALQSILQEFSQVETDKGVLKYDAEEIAVGVEVTDADGNAVADGEYTADSTIYVVKDSKVEEIKEVEEEEETTEEETETEEEMEEEETETTTEPSTEEEEEETPDYQAQIDALKAEIEALKEKIAEIANTPAVAPIEEEFSKVTPNTEKGAARYAKYLKK